MASECYAVILVVRHHGDGDPWDTVCRAVDRTDDVEFLGTPWPVAEKDGDYDTVELIHQRGPNLGTCDRCGENFRVVGSTLCLDCERLPRR